MSDDEEEKHVRGKRVEPNFCTECPETGSCGCENDYRSPCKSEMKDWSNKVAECLTVAHRSYLAAFKVYAANMKNAWKYLKLKGSDNPKVTRWGGAAHHALCVVAVNAAVTDNDTLTYVLPKVQWCINTEDNMLLLPLWPMTINWYASFAKDDTTGVVSHQWREKDAVKPPPFANRAQHDYDHGPYNVAVKQRLTNKIENIQEQTDNHAEKTAEALKTLLNDERLHWKETVCKGPRDTHKAWFDGSAGNEDWWMAFSMAGSLGTGTKRAFPSPNNDKWATSFKKLVEAYTSLL